MPLLLSFLLLLLPAAAPGVLRPDADVDAVLAALEARGADLRTLSADVELAEVDTITGGGFTRRGHLWLRDPQGDPVLRVRFDERIEGRKLKTNVLDYRLADNVLVEQDHAKRSVSERRLAPAGERIDLFKLGEGPFPLPVGQSAEDVRRAFEVETLPAGDGPPDTVGLLLTPRPGTAVAKDAAEIELWVGVADALPREIVTVSVDGTLERTTRLSEVRLNEPIPEGDLTQPPAPQGWRRSVE